MKYFYIIIPVFLLFFGCSSRQEKETDNVRKVEIDLTETGEKLPLSEFVDSVQFIRIDLPDNETVGRPVQACFTDSCFFIYDLLQRNIYRFTRNGRLAAKISRHGQGPGEYMNVTNIMVRNTPEELYVYDKISQRIHVYSFDGDFIRTVQTEKMASSVTVLPDGGFLCFTPDFIYNGPSGIWRMSPEGKLQRMILEYDEKYPIVQSFWSYFYPVSEKEIGISCPATNRYLTYDCEKDTVTVGLEVHPRQKSAVSFPGYDNSLQIKEPYWSCIIDVHSPEYIFGIWTENNGDPHAVYSLYDNKRNVISCYRELETKSMGLEYMGEPIPSDLPGCMVTYFMDGVEDEGMLLCIYHLK